MYFKKVPHFFSYIFPKAVWSIDSNESIYLTFDDGPYPSSTPYLLDLLESLKIKANFFCLGTNAIKYPELIDDIINHGHFLGYHGFEHISGWSTAYNDYIKNAEIPDELNFSKTYRPPYGRMTWRQYNTISEQNDIIMWNVMPGDFDKYISENIVIYWQRIQIASRFIFGLMTLLY